MLAIEFFLRFSYLACLRIGLSPNGQYLNDRSHISWSGEKYAEENGIRWPAVGDKGYFDFLVHWIL